MAAVTPPLSTLPSCWMGEVTLHNRHHVFWVTRGRAHIDANGADFHLFRGQLVWFPIGTTINSVCTTDGTVASSALVPDKDLTMTPEWLQVRQFSSEDACALYRSFSRWIMPQWAVEGIPYRGLPAPARQRIPSSPHLREMAESVLQNPNDGRSLADWASGSGITVRQWSRSFRRETGVNFRQWRTDVRVDRGTRLLQDGMTVTESAHSAGFETVPAFIRAFQQVHDMTPGRYRRAHLHDNQAELSTVTHGSDTSPVTCLGGTSATKTLPRVNRFHVLICAMAGQAGIDVGDARFSLRAGDALWIPAGVWHVITLEDGGAVIPVGQLPDTVPMRRHHMVVKKYSPDVAMELLFRSGVRYTYLRPWPLDVDDPSMIADLSPVPTGVPLHRDPAITEILSSDPAKPPGSLTEWASTLGVPLRRLSARFERDTGQSFIQWQTDRRMVRARELLSTPGVSVSDVARATGYPHASGFTRAFTRRHGMTPSTFRKRYPQPVIYTEGAE